MVKRTLAAVLAVVIALVMSVSLSGGMTALAENEVSFEVGQELNGFIVEELGEFPLVNAQTVLLRHQKTDAPVLFVLNDDVNRAFELSFVTPPENEKGTTHIFEHSTLDGSEKYPSKDLFFNLYYQTYNTFMNAFTYDVMTTYPVASLSEDQLLRYADFYVDSCFHPMLYEDESIFLQEAWRYELTDADSPLTINGTVYSEMLGSYDLSRAAGDNFKQVMFPGSPLGYCFGGKPSDIPDLTWQELLDYHTKYYHPSNSMATVYGDIENPAAFLELLDGYYSAFEKKEFAVEHTGETLTESTKQVFEFPVEEGVDTAKMSEIYYGILVDGVTDEDIEALDLLTTLLSNSSSLMTENLRVALPSASVGAYICTNAPTPAVIFYASGVDEEDADKLIETINASLKQTVEEGFSEEMLDAIMASLEIDTKLITESSSIGVDLMPNLAYYWAMDGDIHGYEKSIDLLNRFKEFQEEGRYNDVINKYLLKENAVTATVITKPAPGLKEQQDAELAAKLADVKAGMTQEEIEALIAQTTEISAGSMGDASEYVAQLQAVTVDSLPEEIRTYDISDETDDAGVRHVDVTANVDSVGRTYLLLDASALTQEQLHWFKLFVDVVGEVDTTEHSRMELSNLITRYMYDPEVRVSVLENADNEQGFVPYLGFRWTAADEDMAAAYDLAYELLYETQFTDAQIIRDIIGSLRVAMRQSIDQDSYSIQLNRAYATFKPMYAYFDYVTQLDYYAFLNEADQMLADDPEAALAMLNGVQQTLKNATNAVSIYAGDEAGIAGHRAVVDAFLARLGSEPITPAAYEFPEISSAEAIVVDSAVNYNMVYASLEQLGLEKFTGDLDAMTTLVNDALLYPLLRDQYGAYGVFHVVDELGMYIVSYADPNIAQTFSTYEQLPAYMAQLQMMVDQETLDGYILSSYSYYAMPTGELTGAMTAAINTLEGVDPTRALQWMRDLKTVTVEDIASYADVYKALIENGIISTSGSQSAINGEKDRYDEILVP